MYIFEPWQPKNIFCEVIGTAAAILGASAVGAAATAWGANKAAEAQTNAANTAAGVQERMTARTLDQSQRQYEQTRQDLSPFRELGVGAGDELKSRLDFLTSPIVMDQAALEKTPGYQFTKTQGLKAVQNSAAARGLGTSGAALKGAATFATGLADQTYQNQFNLENINRTNAYNRLKGLVDLGENAAAQGGVLGQAASQTQATAAQAGATGVGNALIGAGNAQAAASNATAAGIVGATNNLGGYMAYRDLYGRSGVTGPASEPVGGWG